jgi:hypothetical protein
VILVGGVAILALIVLFFASRSGDETAAPVTSETTTAPPPPTINLATTEPAPERFANVLAARDPNRSDELIAVASVGTAAGSYAQHQAAARNILGAANPGSSRIIVDGYQVCSAASSPERSVVCTAFTDFVVTSDNLIESFDVQGLPVAGQVVAGSPPTQAEGITVRAQSAYRSPANNSLTVIVLIENGSDDKIELFPFAATYQLDDGDAVNVDGHWGDATVAAGEEARILVRVPDTELQGILNITGWSPVLEDLEFAVPVTRPA